MGAIRGLIAAVALLASTPAEADAVARWRPFVEEASTRFGIPTRWIEQVMRAESGGHTRLNGRPIRSSKGAMGLMQLMPKTWGQMRDRLGLGSDPDDPRDNILAGTFYLRLMYDRFGYPGLFAAYNAGPGRYAEHLVGRPLPAETTVYLAGMDAEKPSPALKKSRSVFVVRREWDSDKSEVTAPPKIDPLFAIRSDDR